MNHLSEFESSGDSGQNGLLPLDLEVFFDYACPYCLRAHEYLMELLPLYPEVKVVWRPCEAHPRPDRYGPHSDLCIQGMLYALEHGTDMHAYHDIVYKTTLRDRVNVEDIDALTACVSELLDADAFRAALHSEKYAKAQKEANRYAFGESGVWVVPAYRMNGKKLDSVEDVGVTKDMLKNFIDSAI